MASSSKPSDEEMKKRWADKAASYADRRGGVPDPSVPGASQVIWAQSGGGSGLEFGDIAPTIHTDRSGRKYIKNPHGAGDYRFSERTGAWMAPGGDQIMLSEATPVQANNGGGGGGGGNKPDPKGPPGTVVRRPDDTNQVVAGGDQIVNSQMMYDWRPTARNSNGGAAYNPLVNPVNWLHNPEPIKVRNMGTYIVNKKQGYNGGLL